MWIPLQKTHYYFNTRSHSNVSNHPLVSVLIVSDYRAGAQKSWDDMRRCLAGLAHQDFSGVVEFMLLEARECLEAMPQDLATILPGLCLIPCDLDGSYEMKNLAAHLAHADLLMCIDADNIPVSSWITAGVNAMASHPQAIAISGRTSYPPRTILERVLGLLSRSYTDAGTEGPVTLLATNNMIIRREQLLNDPLPEGLGPFAYRLLTEKWHRQGKQLFFCPDMRVVHDFEGWPMERDVRRGVGWTEIRLRQLDDSFRGGRVVRALGALSIPPLYLYRVTDRLTRALPLLRHFGLSWWDAPLVIGLTLYVHALEIPGMVRALRGLDAGHSAYR